MVDLRRVFEITPRRIAGGYAALGMLWIFLSDRLVAAVVETGAESAFVQTVKGWIFVGLSAIFILGATRVREEQLAASRERAIATSQQLQVLQRVFRHNVRNDMTIVRGFLSLVREQATDETEPWLDEIEATLADLVTMSEKLQTLNEVEVGESSKQEIDIVAVIEQEVDRFRDRYPKATVEVRLPATRSVEGDWSIQYAIREALENAMDHHAAPEQARHVEITSVETIHEVTIEIEDDGPGIPAEEVAPIESGRESQLSHGSGIGLWIMAWLCRSLGGSIAFDRHGGTTVRMTFPRADPVEHVAARIRRGLPGTHGETADRAGRPKT